MSELQHFPLPKWLETHSAFDIFVKTYNLTICRFDNASYLFVSGDLVDRLTKDINLLSQYPHIPSHFATVQLDDFRSEPSIDKQLFERAKDLTMLTLDNVCAGLYINALLNNNHHGFAIAVCKEIAAKGVMPLLVDKLEGLTLSYLESGLTSAQENCCIVWALLNVGLSSPMEKNYLLEILSSAFSYNGKIIITSPMDYQSFKKSLINGLPSETSARYLDRMRILFESTLPKSNTISFNETYKVDIRTHRVADALRKHYSDYGTIMIITNRVTGTQRFELIGFPIEIRHLIDLDLEFYKKNPEIPSENICSTFLNYIPQNESQTKCLGKVQELMESDTPKGLFICGPPGVGKTHLAVASGKYAFSRGEESYLIVGFDSDVSKQSPLSKLGNDVFCKQIHTLVIDDINSMDPTTDFYLGKIIELYLNVDCIQRILITTNNPQLKEWNGFKLGNFECVNVVGDSYRQGS